jgi:hypothetical protein
LGAGNCFQRCDRILGAGNVGRIGARPDYDEIIPRDLPAVDTVAGIDKFLLGLGVMHQNQIGVVARGRLKRLAGSLSQDAHSYAGFLGEGGQDVREQARIFD